MEVFIFVLTVELGHLVITGSLCLHPPHVRLHPVQLAVHLAVLLLQVGDLLVQAHHVPPALVTWKVSSVNTSHHQPSHNKQLPDVADRLPVPKLGLI